jgi:hypothetical protein
MDLEKNPKTRMLLKRLLELEDRVRGKPMPTMARVRQQAVYSCGPATLEMLFSFVGLKVTQTGIIRSIRAQNKIRDFGINVNDMAKAAGMAAKKQFDFWRKQNSTLNDLNLILNKYKYPVGVEWQGVFYENADEDSGHYGVITKIDKKAGFVRIADPYFNNYFNYADVDRKFKISDFVKKWWDTNEIKISGRSKSRLVKDIRMMFVITPKGETWPKKIGMQRLIKN